VSGSRIRHRYADKMSVQLVEELELADMATRNLEMPSVFADQSALPSSKYIEK